MKYILLLLTGVFLVSCDNTIIENVPDREQPLIFPEPNEQFTSFTFSWDLDKNSSSDLIKLKNTFYSDYCYQEPISNGNSPQPNHSYFFLFRLYDSSQNILFSVSKENVLEERHVYSSLFIAANFPHSKEAHLVKVFFVDRKTGAETFLVEKRVLSNEEVKKNSQFEYNSYAGCFLPK